MLEVELLGGERLAGRLSEPPRCDRLCALSAARLGVEDGHVAVEFVDPSRASRELNALHRGRREPTDVLSFPIDGVEPLAGEAPRELGDIVICPEHTVDLREAVVHGMLHLLGMDHERDDGEMLALQDELLAAAGREPQRLRRARRAPQRRQVDAPERLVGEKLAIVSDRPQTTRRAIRGVLTPRRLPRSCSSTCPASSAPATRSPRAWPGASSRSSTAPTPRC